MRSKLALGTETIAAALIALAGQVAAASTGSTDIYRNQFRESFGAYSTGSTDLWGNAFRASFGDAPPSVPTGLGGMREAAGNMVC
jgi:hypothetical protein